MAEMGKVQVGAYHKRNLAWPLRWQGGGFVYVTLATRYEAAIRHMLLTPLGSLYYAPDYGTLFYRLRTQSFPLKALDPESENKLAVATAHLRQMTAKYIPDIHVHDAVVDPQDEEQRLRLSCIWTIRGATANMHGDLASQRSTAVLL